MNLPLPSNAEPIVRALDNGMRPAGPVIVVCCRASFDWDNAIVHADAQQQYRWDWVRRLPSVVVVIGNDTRIGTLLADIYAAEPIELSVVNHESKTGWGVLAVRPKLRTFRWAPDWTKDWLGDQTMCLRRDQILRQCGRVAQ